MQKASRLRDLERRGQHDVVDGVVHRVDPLLHAFEVIRTLIEGHERPLVVQEPVVELPPPLQLLLVASLTPLGAANLQLLQLDRQRPFDSAIAEPAHNGAVAPVMKLEPKATVRVVASTRPRVGRR